MRGCVFSHCGSSFFCGDGLIPASFSLTHFACADTPHPPIAPSAATCCKGSEEAEAEGVRGERTLCVPAPSVNRTTFIFPNSQSYYIRHTNASCLQQLRNIIKRRTEFCSSPLFSRCRKASDSCEKLNSVSLVSFRRAASWAAPHFQ